VRTIDDYKRSLINSCLNPPETIAPPSALFPIQVLHAVATICRNLGIPLPAMHLALDDAVFAYAMEGPIIIYSDASESQGYRGLGAVIHDCENPMHGRHYTADMCPK